VVLAAEAEAVVGLVERQEIPQVEMETLLAHPHPKEIMVVAAGI